MDPIGQADPNRFSWQGKYSWSEPVIGSRREWKRDRFRLLIIGACLLPIVSAIAWARNVLSWLFVECLLGVALFAYVYFWVFSFFPRVIVLFDDHIAFVKSGSRGTTASLKVRYSDLKQVRTTIEGGIYLIELTPASGKAIALYSRSTNDVDALKRLIDQHSPAGKEG